MKDRIRKIMESQHMSQQTFAQFIQTSPASLSSIFNGRTKPTLNIVEAIKAKLPSVSTDWLMFGTGPMYKDETSDDATQDNNKNGVTEGMLDFPIQPSPASTVTRQGQLAFEHRVMPSQKTNDNYNVATHNKPERKITEITVFYSDKTWETFIPKISK